MGKWLSARQALEVSRSPHRCATLLGRTEARTVEKFVDEVLREAEPEEHDAIDRRGQDGECGRGIAPRVQNSWVAERFPERLVRPGQDVWQPGFGYAERGHGRAALFWYTSSPVYRPYVGKMRIRWGSSSEDIQGCRSDHRARK